MFDINIFRKQRSNEEEKRSNENSERMRHISDSEISQRVEDYFKGVASQIGNLRTIQQKTLNGVLSMLEERNKGLGGVLTTTTLKIGGVYVPLKEIDSLVTDLRQKIVEKEKMMEEREKWITQLESQRDKLVKDLELSKNEIQRSKREAGDLKATVMKIGCEKNIQITQLESEKTLLARELEFEKGETERIKRYYEDLASQI